MLLTDNRDIKNTKSLVDIMCDYCGNITRTFYKNYIRGRKNIDKDSCTHCVGKKCAEITLKKRQNDLYNKLLKMCECNGFMLNMQKENIINNKSYINYICPKHGEHTMRIANFLSGKGCPDCQHESARERYKSGKDYISEKIINCGGYLLNPDDYINNHEKNLRIRCPSCGKEFVTSFVTFTQHGGQVCNECRSSESIGEMNIRMYLEEKGLNFIQEYWFDDCRDVKPLPFDFYLPERNLIIEFDGRQHYDDTGFFSYNLGKTSKHDKIKNQYCKDNGIKIIRIPYTKINCIHEILDKIFT